MKTNNAAAYPEAKTAICSNILIVKLRLSYRIKDVFRFEKYYRIGKFSS